MVYLNNFKNNVIKRNKIKWKSCELLLKIDYLFPRLFQQSYRFSYV